MSDSNVCDGCGASMPNTAAVVCPQCGATRIAGVHDGAPPLVLEWPDGNGHLWTLTSDTRAIRLNHREESFCVGREDWDRDIYIADVGTKTVVRFSGPVADVGFLVDPDEKTQLFRRIGYEPAPDSEPDTSATDASTKAASLLWPKMTAPAVWGLVLSSLAFIPRLGWIFGLAALTVMVFSSRRLRSSRAMAHVRTVRRISLVILVAGLVVNVLATLSSMDVAALPADDPVLNAAPAQVDWNYAAIGLAIVVVIASLSIHEAAHAVCAWWCGDGYAKSLGRVTLNPLAHLDPFGTVLLPMLLAWAGMPIFGYAKPVPVHLAGVRRYRRAHILISLAGPGSNLLLAAICLAVHLGVGAVLRLGGLVSGAQGFSSFEPQVHLSGFTGAALVAAVILVLKLAVLVNLFLAFFNLIPIPPLDGSWVLEHLFPRTLGPFYERVRPYGFLLFLILIYTDVFGHLLLPAWIALHITQVLLFNCTGLP